MGGYAIEIRQHWPQGRDLVSASANSNKEVGPNPVPGWDQAHILRKTTVEKKTLEMEWINDKASATVLHLCVETNTGSTAARTPCSSQDQNMWNFYIQLYRWISLRRYYAGALGNWSLWGLRVKSKKFTALSRLLCTLVLYPIQGQSSWTILLLAIVQNVLLALQAISSKVQICDMYYLILITSALCSEKQEMMQ